MTLDKPFKIGQYLVTPAEFTIQLDGREKQSLQPKFIEVLCYLAKHHPRVIPRDELIDNIWGENSYVGDKSLTNAIWHLRKNLAKADNTEVIETIRKAGYRLLIEPKWQATAGESNDSDESHLTASDNTEQTTKGKFSLNTLTLSHKIIIAILLLSILISLDYFFHSPSPATNQSIKQITKQPGSELFPAPSPDGRYLVYSQVSGNKPTNLYMQETLQPQLPAKQLTFDQASQGHSVWSNDGQYLYFSRKDEANQTCHYIQLKVASNQEKQVATCPINGGYYYLDISPDDKTLAVYNYQQDAEDTGIYFIDLSLPSHPMKRFSCIKDCGYKDRDMAFSPDGKYIAVSRRKYIADSKRRNRFNENIYLVNLATNNSKQLTFGEEDIVGFSWHPNSKKIVYAAQRADIRHGFVLDIADKTTIELNLAGFSYPSFAKETKQLFYQQRHENSYMASLPLNTTIASTPFPIMQSSFSYSSPDYNAKSGRVAYVSNESGYFELWSAKVDGSERKQLTQLKQTISYPKWSHRGDKIAFLAVGADEEGDRIYIYSTNNQKVTLLSTPFIKHNRPSWSFDDTKVLTAIYTNQFTDIHSIALSDNKVERLTFDGGRHGKMISPTKLIYTNLKRGLWQKDLSNDKKPEQLIDGNGFATLYAWTYHDDTVYFHKELKDHHQLISYQLKQQVTQPLVRLPHNSFSKNGLISYIAEQDTLLFTSDSYPQANIKMLVDSPLLAE